MRASNDSEAIQSKFLENSISVKFSLKTCLCSSLIVVYINKDQILCSASDGEEKKTFRETLNWNNFIHDLIVSNWKKYSSKYSWFTPPLCSSGVPWKVICLLWPQVLLLLLLLLSTTGREKRSTNILILKLAPHSTARVKEHLILFKKYPTI